MKIRDYLKWLWGWKASKAPQTPQDEIQGDLLRGEAADAAQVKCGALAGQGNATTSQLFGVLCLSDEDMRREMVKVWEEHEARVRER